MTNPEEKQEKLSAIRSKMTDAFKANDDAALAAAFEEHQALVTEEIMARVNSQVDAIDSTILAARGVRQLTSTEKKYYSKVIAAMKSADPKAAISNISDAWPTTTINEVLEDIKTAHPLLEKIDFMNTTAVTTWLYNTQGEQSAVWGELTSQITEELSGSIAVANMTLCKLSAYFIIPNDVLDLGPAWVDVYIRSTLTEAWAVGMEAAAVDGTGKDQPIGMTRQVGTGTNRTGGVTLVDGEFPRKTAIEVENLDPVTIGNLMSKISVAPNGKQRVVGVPILVVNPVDYYKIIFPATTIRVFNGGYANNVLPIPCDIVISTAVPDNHAVFGIPRRYFMGVGLGKNGKIETSDQYKFLEDQTTYKIKGYGNGFPKDNNAFLYLDITNLKPTYPTVNNIPVETDSVGG